MVGPRSSLVVTLMRATTPTKNKTAMRDIKTIGKVSMLELMAVAIYGEQ